MKIMNWFFFSDKLVNSTGSLNVDAQPTPHLYHVMFVDQSVCLSEPEPEEEERKNQDVKYTLQMLNPDTLGNPTEHFGDDETGKNIL